MSENQKSQFIENVELAAQLHKSVIAQTPLQRNAFLSKRYEADIYLKREDLTPVRSYKIRGAFNFFRKAILTNGKNQQFVCASAGNHAQGFAFACQHFGVKGVIFMPVTTPQQKQEKTKVFGGEQVEIKIFGDFFDQCYKSAIEYADETGAVMVPPFDHEDIIEGQASVGLEILAQIDKPIDLLILPVGGGGLAAGVAEVMKECSPQTELIFVQPAGAPSFKESLIQGERVLLDRVDNFVDGAAVGQMGQLNFDLLKDTDPNSVMLIPEDRLCETIIEMLNIEGIVLEPAGALELDALRWIPQDKLKDKTIVCIASGGNFDFERLPEVKERALKAAGLKKYYLIRMPQRPGALRELLDLLGPDDDIARFEYLKKSARNFGTILMGVESKRAENFKVLEGELDKTGYHIEDITNDDVLSSFIV
ncbi:MAG: threonine ammonia-lyase IlvA [Rhodomicrobiaceae bacterium]